MNLEQLHVSYVINEDRLLLKMGFISIDETPVKQEVQIFITRRLLQNLWPVLLKAMVTQITIDRPEAAFASDDIVLMEYQQALNDIAESGNFSRPYTSEERESPMGNVPLLLESINFNLNLNQPLHMQLRPANGGSIDIHLTTQLLHGFCKLLQDAVTQAAWGLDLAMPGIEQNTSLSRILN